MGHMAHSERRETTESGCLATPAAHMMRHGRSFADAQALLVKTWPDAYFLNEAFVDELRLRDST